MEYMKNYVGRKIRGFRFEDGTGGIGWAECMEEYINKIGEVIYQYNEFVTVKYMFSPSVLKYTKYEFNYPISLIDQHLVDVDTNVDTFCDIPQLGKGVLMMVSNDNKYWIREDIIAQLPDNRFLGADYIIYNFCKPIPQLPKYTHAELVEKLGHDFEYGGKDE